MSYEYVMSALKKEAGKWDELADNVRPVHEWVASAKLELTAFLIVDGTGLARLLAVENPISSLILKEAYEACRADVEKALAGAVTEFEQIGDAVRKTIKVYDEKDRIIEEGLDYDKIYTA